ncbi:hypothetical protein NPIL_445931 [Nephila pilipes]|uniref:Uncharacterized protein n=1 Tax=Nephila pilipes TaxID=299642 RepID=A0A8X6TUU9_NEPPI|nr:hypothetical protein NPIL_445931 [Nephila pilipes]
MIIQVIDMINAPDYEVRSPAGIIWYLCGYECPCSYGYRPHLTGTPFIVVQLQKHVRRLTVMVTLSRERAFRISSDVTCSATSSQELIPHRNSAILF